MLTREFWQGLSNLSGLDTAAIYTKAPDSTVTFAGSAAPANAGNLYVSRIRGYIIPPESGNYTFWISSDDDSVLLLSTTDSKFQRAVIASVAGWTAPNAWDTKSSQKSQTVALEAGQRYFIEIVQQDNGGGDHVELAWQIQGGNREAIPASVLESYSGDPLDTDNDDLPDALEIEHDFIVDPASYDKDQLALADPDLDGYTNWEEAQLGMNPHVHSGLPGSLSLDTWTNLYGGTVEHLLASPRFPASPDISEFLPLAGTPFDRGEGIGSRMRGFIIPPVSGSYRFFLAGDDASELALSTGTSQFEADLIASFDGFTASQQWFKFPGQASELIELEAGRKYYIEALTKDAGGPDFLEIAWQRPDSSEIEIIPGSALETHALDPADPDGDDIPEDWSDFYEPDALDPTEELVEDFEENPEEDETEETGSASIAPPAAQDESVIQPQFFSLQAAAAPVLTPAQLKKKPDTSNLSPKQSENILGY